MWLFTGPGPAQWVQEDEWRQVTRPWTLDGLLTDHNSHLSLVPIVIYKAMFAWIGFSTFWPYRALAVLVSAGIAVLVRDIMIRGRISPWIATLCAGPLLFVQGGSIVIGQFQMTIAMTLGLIAVRVAMAKSAARSISLGALCSAGALASSGVAIPIVAATAIIAWGRHGWRTAALLTLPGIAAYTCWWLACSPDVPMAPREPAMTWLATALWQVPLALAGTQWAAGLLVTALVVGAAAAPAKGRLPKALVLEPGALTLAAVLMFALSYVGRGFFPPQGPGFARFVFLGCTLILPLLAMATQRAAARHLAYILPVAMTLALGAVVNLAGWARWTESVKQAAENNRIAIAALLASPAGRDVPDWVQPDAMGGISSGTGNAPWAVLREISAARIGVDHVLVPQAFANERYCFCASRRLAARFRPG